MALTDETLSLIAFKNLSGKSQTDNNKALGNEAEGIFLNVPAQSIFLDPIDSSAAQAVLDGVALQVTADMVEDLTSNGHAFFATWPNPLPAGAPVGVSPGDRITNAIPPSFGFEYEAVPADTGSATIPVGDPRDWIYQYQSGIFYQQDVVGNDPLTLDLYVYIGQLLSDIDFNNLSGGGSGEWQSSVLSIEEDELTIVGATPTTGDRYLIIDDGGVTGAWIGNENKIAEWDGATWVYTDPTDGMSVKVDNLDGKLYHYEGSTSTWVEYNYGQIRPVTVTGTDTYLGSINPSIDAYTEEIILLAIFANDNTGASTLNIDSLGAVPIRKDDGSGNLIDVVAGDIQANIVYFLAYDGTGYQLKTSAAGTAGVIGPAEDGDYTDGVFTDFIASTPTGTAIDRFNELLKSLVPPPAPDLSHWSATLAGDVTGKLSFDDTQSILGYVGANNAPSNPISVDGTWTISGKRLGIKPVVGNITGTLNDQVVADSGTPTPAYVADSFGNANQGSLNLYVNGVLSNTLDLTSSSAAINTTSGNTQSGFSVSAESPSLFTNGNSFDTFVNRTGTWLVHSSDANLTNGYNYAYVEHDTGTTTLTLDRFEWIIDDDTTNTSYSGGSLSGLSMTGSKKLSGIDYHTGGTASYGVTIDNAYRNTYSPDADAISFNGNSNSTGLLISAPSQALAANGGDEGLQIVLAGVVGTLTSSGRRIINGSISLEAEVKRTVQGTTTGGLASISGILLDNITDNATEVGFENFRGEDYRLTSNLTYDVVGDIATGTWDSDQSLLDGSAGHTDGLQIVNDQLIYPVDDYRTATITNGSSFNDGGVGGGARNYTTSTGDRTYIRYFRQVSPTTANFIMNIAGSGGTFVPLTTALSGNNIHVEIKAPSETGWMDAYADFATGQFADGDGARSATDGAGRAFGTNWGLTIGTKSTANTSGYMVLRITVSSSFTGQFDSITWTYN